MFDSIFYKKHNNIKIENHIEPKPEKKISKNSPKIFQHPAFDGISERDLIEIYNIVEIKKCKPGDFLFHEGDSAKKVYLILDGSIKIIKKVNDYSKDVAILIKGDLVGERAFIDKSARTGSGIAIEPTTIICLNENGLNTLSHTIQSMLYKNLTKLATKRIFDIISQEKNFREKNEYLISYIKNCQEKRSSQYVNSSIIKKIIKSLPQLPMYASRLTIMLNDEDVSVQEVVELAQQDPSLVSAVLKTINSSFYNLRNKITNFKHAVLLLGFNQIYQMVLDSGLRKTMPNTSEFQELQFHSYMVSVIGIEICKICATKKPIMVSTTGLLHDIGKSIILLLKEQYKDLQFFIDFLDQAKVGSMLLKEWNIPDTICLSIEYQAYPKFTPPEKISEEIRENIAILYISQLTYYFLKGKSEKQLPVAFIKEYLNILNFKEESLPRVVKNHILPSLNKKFDSLPENVKNFLTETNKLLLTDGKY